jgi:periplasmic divalent cation tolerance protein
MNAKTKYLEVTTTVSSQDLASTIASALVERHLAACVQISGPITSVYRWEATIETSTEYRLTAKTTAAVYKRLLAAVLELHPYDVPEVLAVPILDGHADYLTWLDEQVES